MCRSIMVSALHSGEGCPASSPGESTVLCSWILLSQSRCQGYKWAMTNLKPEMALLGRAVFATETEMSLALMARTQTALL